MRVWVCFRFALLFGIASWTQAWFQALQPSSSARASTPLALVTGGSGRTGRMVCQLLVERGFALRVLARNVTKAQECLLPLLPETAVVEFCPGDLAQPHSVQAAFATTSSRQRPLTHVVYTAGGDDTDYYAVSYKGVALCAQEAARSGTVQHFVFISTAWATRPYSIASLLFNSLYDTIPMACHYMGEQELRRQATTAKKPFSYVILRPGGLNQDKRYAQKYPEAYAVRQDSITYHQGDNFTFLGPAGLPGMCRSQLAHVVATATTGVTRGRYTVEVTGSGSVNWDDASVFTAALKTDDEQENVAGMTVIKREDEVFSVHGQAVDELKLAAAAASLAGLASIFLFGWAEGVCLFLAVDAVLIALWRKLYADQQM